MMEMAGMGCASRDLAVIPVLAVATSTLWMGRSGSGKGSIPQIKAYATLKGMESDCTST